MRRLQLSRFHGRFGNQVGQYAFSRSLASRFKAHFECPDWIGRQVFANVDDPLLTDPLPDYRRDGMPTEAGWGVHGYFQFQEALDIMSRRQLQQWLTVRPEWLALCPKPRPFYIACHVRRGDYAKAYHDVFAVVERDNFERALLLYGYALDDVIWLTAEEPQPGSAALPEPYRFLYDFMVLLQADVVFRANSTFSFWAAELGHCRHVYSPVVEDKVGPRHDIPFVEGNHMPCFSTRHHPHTRHSELRLPA
jgi:hypothetical protein